MLREFDTVRVERGTRSNRNATTSDGRNPLLGLHQFFRQGPVSAEGWSQVVGKGRESESFYRDRWQHDKVVRSTHGAQHEHRAQAPPLHDRRCREGGQHRPAHTHPVDAEREALPLFGVPAAHIGDTDREGGTGEAEQESERHETGEGRGPDRDRRKW